MNIAIFFIHILIVISFLLLALKLGKNYLLVFIVIQALIANIFVIKQIDLFSKVVTATDVFIVGAILSQNLLQEYYGKKEANKSIYITFFSLVFFLIMSKIHLLYQPSKFDMTEASFQTILSPSFRIISASIFVFFLVQKLDVYIFGFLKKIFQNKALSTRLCLSALLTQFLDTIMFSFLGLYGMVERIFDIILISFLIKIGVVLLSSSFIGMSRLLFKNLQPRMISE